MPAGSRSTVITSGVLPWSTHNAAACETQGEVMSEMMASWFLPEVSVAVTTRPFGSVRVSLKMTSLLAPVLVLQLALY